MPELFPGLTLVYAGVLAISIIARPIPCNYTRIFDESPMRAIRMQVWLGALAAYFAAAACGATFGTPVSIGGQAADLALDEARGVLYIANFTANRIEVMSLADN